MPTVEVFNLGRQKVGSVDLDDAVFGAPANDHLLHEAVVMQMANRRAGTAATKTRGLVRGGGRKPYRQKGTGQARRGSSRSPLLSGGAVAFGPQPRDWSYRLPRKARRAALRSALSQKVREQRLVLLDDIKLPAPKTREFAKVLKAFEIKKALVVDDKSNTGLYRSARNIRDVKFLPDEGLNVYDVLKHEHLVLSVAAARKIEGALKA
jgi:large subunit ribosomal protein L4